MESIISELSMIENEAKNILKNATQKKEQLFIQLEKDISDLENKYSQSTKSKLEKIQTEYDLKYQTQINLIQHNSNEEISRLEQKYKENHDSYIDELFSKIIRG